jgi:hypothetical protein
MSKGQTSMLSGGSASGTFRALPVTSVTRSSASVTGSGWTKVIASPRSGRAGVLVWNASASLQAVGKIVAANATAPSGGILTDGDFALAPRQSVLLELGPQFDLYAINESGATTTSTVVCTEVVRS